MNNTTIKTRIETQFANLFPLAHELLKPLPPDYLFDATLSLQRILKKNIKSRTLFSATGKWLTFSDDTEYPYNIELGELEALRNVFLKRISLTISPNSTTQENFVVNAIEMIHQVISNKSCKEPIFLITKSSQSLNTILENLVTSIPDLIHCGSTEKCSDNLRERNINCLMQKSSADNPSPDIRTSIKKLKTYVEFLKATKSIAISDDSFVDAAPQDIRVQFEADAINLLPAWLRGNTHQEALRDIVNLPNASESANFDKQPLPQLVLDNLSDDISKMWKNYVAKFKNIWKLPLFIREKIRESYDEIITNHVRSEINETLHAITSLKKCVENIHNVEWLNTVERSTLVGMNISHALQHQNSIKNLEPRVIIVNEASLIPEGLLIPFLSSRNLEHLILVGEKISIENDISLFEHLVRQGAPHIKIDLPRKSSSTLSISHKNLHESDNDPVDKPHTELPSPLPRPNNTPNTAADIIQDTKSSSAVSNKTSDSVKAWYTENLANSAWWLPK
ncbi:5291_t:CDS:2 [Ambispora leptoticha]|uniref:5291_t:CDS:1 n=1 Tax=Ambispora leptoticha TaxID=144679 RepID=A0A9N9B390_9GLOM|nr:5291_t:CDS:2 [Ambispora leptoticha]